MCDDKQTKIQTNKQTNGKTAREENMLCNQFRAALRVAKIDAFHFSLSVSKRRIIVFLTPIFWGKWGWENWAAYAISFWLPIKKIVFSTDIPQVRI